MNCRPAMAACLALVGTLACGLGAAPSTKSDLEATITAQALAMESRAGTPTAVEAARSGSAELSVSAPTDCRAGPGGAFELAFTANPGRSFDLIGKNTASGSWIIANPAGGNCWLAGPSVTVLGDTTGLPEYPVPPLPPPPQAEATRTPKPTKTPTSSPPSAPSPSVTKPNAPSGLDDTYSMCNSFFVNGKWEWHQGVTIVWQDNADNEQGYGVYQNDLLIATQPKDSTYYYFDSIYDGTAGFPLTDVFAVEAFNIAGSSARSSISHPRCKY